MILAVFVAGGAAINYFDLGYRTNTQEIDLLEYIRDHKAEGDVYLLACGSAEAHVRAERRGRVPQFHAAAAPEQTGAR